MAKQKATKQKTKASGRISNVTRPSRMSLKEWQIKLRIQAAEKEKFSITGNGNGEFVVSNYSTSHKYEAVWKGFGHPLNRCSCMDFRTSRLMTCKHLEAVKKHIQSNKSYTSRRYYSCLYVDYSAMPRLRLYCAGKDAMKIRELGNRIFDADGFADMSSLYFLRIRYFINDARKCSPDFICTSDAQEMIDRFYDDKAREERLNEIFCDRFWWKEYLVKGIIPYPYQVEGMEFAARAGRCLIADEMGLGKTIQAIGAASLLHREGFVDSVLIVCPTSLKYQWQKEIKKFSGKDALVIEGLQTQRIKMYDAPQLFKIVSYNALSNDMKSLKEMTVDMLIMDEVQRLKNWNTQIAKGVRRIKADYKVILSGTPLENKLEELYSVVQLADQYSLGPYYEFRDNHIMSNDTGKVIGYKNLNEVGQSLGHLLKRRRKCDVALQLPERMDKNLFVPMTKEQMAIHDELKGNVARLVFKWKKMHYLSDTDRRRLLLMLSQMRMVCDSTYILDQQSRYDTKVDESISIIKNVVESGDDKVVIFSQWERMTRLVAQELEKAGVGYEYLYGGVPSAKRRELMDNFNDNPDVRVFISTDAGSTGLNLQTASYLINLDLPWNPAVLEQRIGRIYRIGQRKNIQVINLVSMNTIEEQMLAKLQFKSSMFAGALDGGDDEVLLEGNKLQEIVEQFDFENAEEQPAVVEIESVEEAVQIDIDTEFIPAVMEEQSAMSDAVTADAPNTSAQAPVSEQEPDFDPAVDVVRQGVSFITGLVEVLKDPQASKRMVDTLVTEDKETGKASLNIPVKDKESVMQFVSLLGKLLNP